MKKISKKAERTILLLILLSFIAVAVYATVRIIVGVRQSKDIYAVLDSSYMTEPVTYTYEIEPDFDEDITQDRGYLDKNRLVRYQKGACAEYIDCFEDQSSRSEELQFLLHYIKVVISGDCESYADMFWAEYDQDTANLRDPQELFTPQKLYNIEIKYLSRQTVSPGTVKTRFMVSFCIYKNNGTFCNLIRDEETIPFYYELVNQNGIVRISQRKLELVIG